MRKQEESCLYVLSFISEITAFSKIGLPVKFMPIDSCRFKSTSYMGISKRQKKSRNSGDYITVVYTYVYMSIHEKGHKF